MVKVLFIGEHPKGNDVAFDPSTRSGNRLRTMVANVGVEAEYMNLWASEHEQASGKITSDPISKIIQHKALGGACVALGRRVDCSLMKLGVVVQYLPHPGARRTKDHDALRAGILKLKGDRMRDFPLDESPNIKLKSCPFCGGDNITLDDGCRNCDNPRSVGCDDCDFRLVGADPLDPADLVIKKWNNRPTK